MKFISWNVNGLRACVQKGFLDFFREADAYIASKRIGFTVQQPQLTFFDNMFCFNPFRIERNGL